MMSLGKKISKEQARALAIGVYLERVDKVFLRFKVETDP